RPGWLLAAPVTEPGDARAGHLLLGQEDGADPLADLLLEVREGLAGDRRDPGPRQQVRRQRGVAPHRREDGNGQGADAWRVPSAPSRWGAVGSLGISFSLPPT